MESNLLNLIDIMQKECEIYTQLKAVEVEKKQIIIDNDVKALEKVTAREQGFLKTIVHLEELRAEVVDGFCSSIGLEKFETINDILNVLKESEKKKLTKVRDELYSVTTSLKEVNELNNMLLNQSIDYINYTIEVARSTGEENVGYDDGANDRLIKVDKSLFDVRV